MKVLALDIATKTGWCTETAYGTWFKTESWGERRNESSSFKSKVSDYGRYHLVSYERVAGMHKSSIMVASEMVGVLKDLCVE
jgi:hypothetical protein